MGCTVCRHRVDHDGGEHPYEGYAGFELPTSFPAWPRQLTFALRNTCNLECVMCGADRSSRIRSRRAGLEPLPGYYEDHFFGQLEPFLEHCDRVEFVGGEPFLIKEHLRVWNLLSELGLSPEVGVTTNGTIWNATVEDLLQRFDTDVRISIDGYTTATFEAVRRGASAELVFANLERFLEYTRSRGTQLIINWSLLRHNWFELAPMLIWAEERKIPVKVMTVIEPAHGLQRIPDSELEVARMVLADQAESSASILQINRAVWEKQLRMIDSELDRRSAGTPTVPYMEPPSDANIDLLVESLRTMLHAPRRSSDEARRQDHLQEMLRWSIAENGTTSPQLGYLRLNREGQMTHQSLSRMFDMSARPLSADPSPKTATTDPTDVGELIELIELLTGGRTWIADQVAEVDSIRCTLLFGSVERDKRFEVLHLCAYPVADGVEVLACRDDWFVRSSSLSMTAASSLESPHTQELMVSISRRETHTGTPQGD